MVGIFSCNGEDDESKGDKLVRICNDLNMEERQLIRLQKENSTKTARAIVRAYYPAAVRNEIKPEEIDDNFRNAIHDYVQLIHGLEGLTRGKINESINNVFRSAKSQNKKDRQRQSEQSTTSNMPTMGIRKYTNDKNKEHICYSNH
ncbi:unnamed protein product [Rotaria magnacalcarata]|uniref:Uncharacterized protein n=1 Tax=Rotaria magnacalcarata TaxID=392030 RepID=A0A8S3IKN5_9BILA|nr:unnamed protein product [Rotaria magnacalcarata]